MAGNVWSIMIVPGAELASFVPDVYVPPGTKRKPALQAEVSDMVSWNNQTGQEHEIWQKGDGVTTSDTKVTEQIEPWTSSTPAYIVPGTAGVAATINYYCAIHTDETGSIDVIS